MKVSQRCAAELLGRATGPATFRRGNAFGASYAETRLQGSQGARARAHVLAIGLSVIGLRRAYLYRLFLTARLLRTHCRSRFRGTEVLSARQRLGRGAEDPGSPEPQPPPAHCWLVSDSISSREQIRHRSQNYWTRNLKEFSFFRSARHHHYLSHIMPGPLVVGRDLGFWPKAANKAAVAPGRAARPRHLHPFYVAAAVVKHPSRRIKSPPTLKGPPTAPAAPRGAQHLGAPRPSPRGRLGPRRPLSPPCPAAAAGPAARPRHPPAPAPAPAGAARPRAAAWPSSGPPIFIFRRAGPGSKTRRPGPLIGSPGSVAADPRTALAPPPPPLARSMGRAGPPGRGRGLARARGAGGLISMSASRGWADARQAGRAPALPSPLVAAHRPCACAWAPRGRARPPGTRPAAARARARA